MTPAHSKLMRPAKRPSICRPILGGTLSGRRDCAGGCGQPTDLSARGVSAARRASKQSGSRRDVITTRGKARSKLLPIGLQDRESFTALAVEIKQDAAFGIRFAQHFAE